jgi:hypothetical protein
MTRVYVYSSALVAFVAGTSIIYPARAASLDPMTTSSLSRVVMHPPHTDKASQDVTVN